MESDDGSYATRMSAISKHLDKYDPTKENENYKYGYPIYLSRPKGLPFNAFKDIAYESFLKNCPFLVDSDISKQAFNGSTGCMFYLSLKDHYDKIINEISIIVIHNGSQRFESTVHPFEGFNYNIELKIEKIPLDFTTEEEFEGAMQFFCYSEVNGEPDSNFVSCRLETNKAGTENTGILYISHINERIHRQGGKTGFCFDEKPQWRIKDASMSFYIKGDSPTCKICLKRGHETFLCYPVINNFIKADEIATPEKLKSADIKARTITGKDGSKILLSSPGKGTFTVITNESKNASMGRIIEKKRNYSPPQSPSRLANHPLSSPEKRQISPVISNNTQNLSSSTSTSSTTKISDVSIPLFSLRNAGNNGSPSKSNVFRNDLFKTFKKELWEWILSHNNSTPIKTAISKVKTSGTQNANTTYLEKIRVIYEELPEKVQGIVTIVSTAYNNLKIPIDFSKFE